MKERTLTLNINATDKQKTAWKAALFNPLITELGYGGGGGGGKSWFGSDFLNYMCCYYPDTRWVMGRRELKNLKRTSLSTYFKVIAHHKLKPIVDIKYNEQSSIITYWNKSQIILLDMDFMPTDPLYLRFGGLELTGALVEESNEISYTGIDILKTRLGRWNNEKYNLKPILIETFNPDKGHVYKRYFKPTKENTMPQNRLFIKALPTDNPYLPQSYIEQLKNADKTTRERLLYGNFEYDDNPNSLFQTDNIYDLFSNELNETNIQKYITSDIARFGADKTVIMVWEGLTVIEIKIMSKNSTVEVASEIRRIATRHQVPMSRVLVDEDGVGGGVVDMLRCKGFVGGSSAIIDTEATDLSGYKAFYQNLRSQCFYTLADYVSKAKIAVPVDDTEIVQWVCEELEQIQAKDIDKDGRLKIISKDLIKEHLGRSTDFADCLMMRMYFEVNVQSEPNVTWL